MVVLSKAGPADMAELLDEVPVETIEGLMHTYCQAAKMVSRTVCDWMTSARVVAPEPGV